MIRQFGIFLAGAAILWVASFVLGWMLWPDQHDSLLTCSLTALVLCLIPTALTFLWTSWARLQTPDLQLITVLGGTGVRMFFVLGLGLLLSNTVSYLHANQLNFWLWVLIYYLGTLTLEMVLLVREQAKTEKASGTKSPTSI